MFDAALPDTVVVQLSFVPTHPLENDRRPPLRRQTSFVSTPDVRRLSELRCS